MTQLSLFQSSSTVWTVSKVTRYLHELIDGDESLKDIWVQGEVSNLSRPGSGHMYFTLKDSSCSLQIVMWKNSVLRQVFLPREGEAIEIHGYISIYDTQGRYQLYADLIRPSGEGALYQEFLRLKARLEAEGLFAQERKRPIPHWPNCIGIVTSPTGAALRDMINTLLRRYTLCRVVLAPTQVQGDDAPAGIVAAIAALNRVCQPDVILVCRGGGSIEDLWAFNDERVARAIAASAAPIISGVGHETDFTIADFVSDLRAPTPTAAAELATPNRLDLKAYLDDSASRLHRVMHSKLENRRWSLDRQEHRLALHSPRSRVLSGRQRLDDLTHRAGYALSQRLALHQARLSGLEQRLACLNPLSVLGRGYSLVVRQDGRLVRSVYQVQPGEDLDVRVSDGAFGVRVRPAFSDEEDQTSTQAGTQGSTPP